ncbi:head-tail connector protein [Desulfovibrio sp. OttesenSCG-928-F20]|nr:head-tail connector protein [Desulfovibrio sp. OttesenSCG-928-F20]
MKLQALQEFADSVWRSRETVNPVMEELARYICPDARGFQSNQPPDGEGREDIWDSTPEEAASMLAAALGSLLSNPATAWFSLDLAGDVEKGGEVGEWLTGATRIMLDEMAAPESCFYQEIDVFYIHLVSLAWAVLFIEYRDGRGLVFKSLPPKECALTENADGLVDTLVRRFTMTAAQLREEFGEDKLSDEAKQALAKDPLKRFVITHLVLPKEKLPKDSLGNGQKAELVPPHAFVSVLYEEKAEQPLHTGGYFSFPFVVPRWSKRAGEVYGRGPGHAALPDIRVLNRVSMSQLDAAEKASNSPILAPDDSVLDRKINTYPGGVTWYRPSGGEFMPLPATADLGAMQVIREERKDAIRRLFLNDRIQLAGGADMTATEVMARQHKQMQSLGPVLGRLQSAECLGRLISRVFELLWRNGRFDDKLPQGLTPGQNLRVRYVSPITRAQKQAEADNFVQALHYIAPLADIYPDLMDHFDMDVIVRDTRELFAYPAKYLKDEKQVERERMLQSSGGAA